MSQAKLISTLALCLFMMACSEQKKLNDMHDATESMEQTTRKMNDTTAEMNKKTSRMADTTDSLAGKTEELKNTTNELYDALRQGNALQLRREAWNSVMMAPTMFKRISEAAKYFMSYEVQLWNHYGQDGTLEKRDILAQQATQEFFLEIEDLAARDGSVSVFTLPLPSLATSQTNRTAAFNAFAAAMHQLNRKQNVTLQKDASLESVSMLSLMEEALLAKKDMENGSASLGTKVPFIREVLAHEGKAIQILQTRYNFFALMFVDVMTGVGEFSAENVSKMLKMGFTSWDLDLDKLNATQLEYYQTEVLQQSIRARNMLIKIGVKPEMDWKLARILKNAKVKAKGDKSPAVMSAQTNLIGMLREIQPEMK